MSLSSMGHGAHSQRRCGASGPGGRSPGQRRAHDRRWDRPPFTISGAAGSGACVGDQLNQDGEPCGIRLLWVVCYGLSVMPAVRSGSGSSVRLPAKLTAASVMVCPSCCLAGRSALPLEPGDGGHRGMPTDRQGQAVEPTKSAMHEVAGHRSAQEPGWLVERLRLGVGHASTVRPDPSILGVVGERGSRHEGRSPARSR